MAINLNVPEIFGPIFEQKKRFNLLHGGRGSGKTEAMARKLLVAGMEKTQRILCTREIQKTIAESVHQVLEDVITKEDFPYLVQKNAILCQKNETEFIFSGLRDHLAAGVKSMTNINLCWVEEAQTITKKTLDILTPTIRAEGSQLFFTMNRIEEEDPVYVKYKDPDENTLVIFANWWDNPWFPDVLELERTKCKKEESASVYAHVWEGQPFEQSETAALKMSELRLAMEREVEADGPVEIGVDVARGGGDAISVYKRHGMKCIGHWETKKEMHPDEIVSRTDGMTGPPPNLVRVDDTAMGWAVSLAFEKRYGKGKVHAINFASKDGIDKTKYPDFMSHMYFEFAKILPQVQLPMDLELLKELAARQYHFNNPLKLRQIESKDDFKLRLKRSPDNSDALLLCYVGKRRKELVYF